MPRGSPALLQGPSFVRNEAPPYRSPLSSLISERAVGDDASSNDSFVVRSVLHVFRFRLARLFSTRFLSPSSSVFASLLRSICPRSRTHRPSPSLVPPVLRFLPLLGSSSSSLLSFRLEVRVSVSVVHSRCGWWWCLVLGVGAGGAGCFSVVDGVRWSMVIGKSASSDQGVSPFESFRFRSIEGGRLLESWRPTGAT